MRPSTVSYSWPDMGVLSLPKYTEITTLPPLAPYSFAQTQRHMGAFAIYLFFKCSSPRTDEVDENHTQTIWFKSCHLTPLIPLRAFAFSNQALVSAEPQRVPREGANSSSLRI